MLKDADQPSTLLWVDHDVLASISAMSHPGPEDGGSPASDPSSYPSAEDRQPRTLTAGRRRFRIFQRSAEPFQRALRRPSQRHKGGGTAAADVHSPKIQSAL